MKLNKKKINIENFHFINNPNYQKELDNLEIEIVKDKLISIKKFLNIKTKTNLEKHLIQYIFPSDFKEAKINLTNILENSENQKKIIKFITNHNKIISKQILQYIKDKLPDYVTYEIIINRIIEYIRIKYNELSIINYEIDSIIFQKKQKYILQEEGPIKLIPIELDEEKDVNYNKKCSCNVL